MVPTKTFIHFIFSTNLLTCALAANFSFQRVENGHSLRPITRETRIQTALDETQLIQFHQWFLAEGEQNWTVFSLDVHPKMRLL